MGWLVQDLRFGLGAARIAPIEARDTNRLLAVGR
jgi:hypothetical protein